MGATISGTKAYFSTHPLTNSGAITLGKTGWQISPVGFGCYRIYDTNTGHIEALKLALESGCNLIDASTNYTNGSAEKGVGKVLSQLIGAKNIARDQVVVVTKVGYVQGENMKLARSRVSEDRPFSEMVEYNDDCWHCISPDFLEDQITRSLQRLGLKQIDVLLLHNPEYFLKSGGDHSEYYRRIKAAFEYLETEVRKGRIQYYGVSSNTFPEPKEHPEYTSLETLLEFGGEHFAVIQFPMNLYEPGAALEENNSGKSVAELARKSKIGTLVNRPLNAFLSNGKMSRLADFTSHHGIDTATLVKDTLAKTMELESRYPGAALIPAKKIAWGHILRENVERLAELDTWTQVLNFQIRPVLEAAFHILRPAHAEWVTEYQNVSNALFESFTAFLESKAAIESQVLKATLNQACPALKSSKTLSQKAIRIYRSIPGIDCVLVGMRKTAYVKDILDLQPALTPEEAIEALTGARAHEEQEQRES